MSKYVLSYIAVHILLFTRRVRKVKIHHMKAEREIFYAYCGNTAVDLDPLPVSRARLTEVEQALSETFFKRQRRSKVQPNARCLPSYDFATHKMNASGNSQTDCCCLW
jgi:hypothetical protein